MTQLTPTHFATLEELQEFIVDSIASKAQSEYVKAFHAGAEPTQPERINPQGQRVNYKKTKDQAFIERHRAHGLVLSGNSALAKPQGGIIEIDGVVSVDLAGRQYDDLPSDHQELNQNSARVAARELIKASVAVHDSWVMDNAWQVTGAVGNDEAYSMVTAEALYDYVALQSDEVQHRLELFVPFGALPPEEQDKDFVFVIQTASVLSDTLNLSYEKDAIDGIALGIKVANAVHDEWVMENLGTLAKITGDESVLNFEDPSQVYGYVVNLEDEALKVKLGNFVPFSELPQTDQAKSLGFVIEAAEQMKTQLALSRSVPTLS
jgi:hypothetical protein